MDDEVDWELVARARRWRKAEVEGNLFDAAGVYEHLQAHRKRWVRAALQRQIDAETELKIERRERWHGAWGDDPRRLGRDVVTAGRFDRNHVLRMMRRVDFEHRVASQRKRPAA